MSAGSAIPRPDSKPRPPPIAFIFFKVVCILPKRVLAVVTEREFLVKAKTFTGFDVGGVDAVDLLF